MGEHERLKNPTAAEVLFEIRFDTDRAFSSYVDQLARAFQDKYPKREDLEYQSIDIQFGPEGPKFDSPDPTNERDLPLARFKTEEGQNLFQVGSGILTVNTIEYRGFNKFVSDVKEVVEKHSTIAAVKSCRRFGLRYINHMELTSPEDIFSWIAPLPPNLLGADSLNSNVQEVLLNYREDFQKVAVAYPRRLTNGQVVATLDIDHFKEFQDSPSFTLDYLQQWIQSAHEFIWHTYTRSLEPGFYERIKNG